MFESNEIRKIMRILNEADNGDIDQIDEGPAAFANRVLSKLGSKRAAGRVQRDDLARPLKSGFQTWIGRTNRQGTAADIEMFLKQSGFPQDAVTQIIGHLGAVGSARQEPSINKPQDSTTTTDTKPTQTSDNPAAEPAIQPSTPQSPPNQTAPVEPDSAAILQRKQRQSKDMMNFHDGQRQKAFDRHDSLNGNEPAQQKLKNRANLHRDAYNSHKADYEKHSADLKAMQGQPSTLAASRVVTGNKLMELNLADTPLSRGEINNIFTQAAAYAHDNNLVGNRVSQIVGSNNSASQITQTQQTSNGTPSQGQQYGGYNPNNDNTNSPTSASASMQTNANSNEFSTVLNYAMTSGKLSKDTINDLKARIQPATSAAQMGAPADKNALMILGFAFLKSVKD